MADEPRATALKKIILTTMADKAQLTHGQRVAKATKELTEAEALLKKPGVKPLRYVALYRLTNKTSPTKGTYAERREHLIARFKALSGTEHHVSTSAWSMLSYHANSRLVLSALKPAIDEKLDYLEVVQTALTPVHVGVSKLES